MLQTLLVTILSLSLFSLSVRADQVTLKNGDQLSVAIVKSEDDAKTLLIKMELAGDVTIPWDAITGIVSRHDSVNAVRNGAQVRAVVDELPCVRLRPRSRRPLQ